MSPKHVIDYTAAGPRAALIAGKLAQAIRDTLHDPVAEHLVTREQLISALSEWDAFTRER